MEENHFTILWWFCHTSTWTVLMLKAYTCPLQAKTPSCHTFPPGCHRAPFGVLRHTSNSIGFFHMWQCICFHAILSNHPTLSLSHWVQKSVLYMMFPLSSSCKLLELWWCRVIFGSTVHQTYLGCTSPNGSEPLPHQKSWRTNTYFIRTLERLKRIDLCIKSPKHCPEQNKNVQGSKWLKVKWSTFCYHTLGGEQLISIFLFLAHCGSLT